MRVQTSLALLAGSAWLAAAAPATETTDNSELRLIKTSPTDPGTWVTEEQKITDYTAKNIGFVDITDITVRLPASTTITATAMGPIDRERVPES